MIRRRNFARTLTAAFLLAVAAALLLLPSAPGHAQSTTYTYVSNIDQGSDNDWSSSLGRAQNFTTGSQSGGYTVTSVDIGYDDEQGDKFNATIWKVTTVNSADVPDTDTPASRVANLTAPTGTWSAGDTLTFTAPTGTTLDADTTYAVVTTNTGNAVKLDSTTSHDEDTGVADGWSIADGGYSHNNNAWNAHASGETLRIAIKGTTAPAAQTGSVVWEATMTVPTAWANSGTTYEGYGSSASSVINLNHGTLTPDSFTFESTTHTVELLAYTVSSPLLYFFTDTAAAKDDLAGLSLIITVDGASKTLAVSDATNATGQGATWGIYWASSDHGYSSGDWAGKTVTVQLWSPNNLATGAPTISGTAQVGETLTAAIGSIADADRLTTPAYTYQWVRVDGATESDISGATAAQYTLVADDEGKTIKVKLSFTDDLGNAETRTSAATGTVAAANNPATGAPTISGTAQVGETLTAGIGSIADTDGLTTASFDHQWVRVDGATESDISGATAPEYTLVAADEGKTIKVKVSFTDDLGNAETRTSAATGTVAAAANNPATGAPTISGTAWVGDTLTAATGDIMDSDGLGTPGYTYQWVRVDGATESDISGATSRTYTLVAADLGKTIKVKVSFTDDNSNAETLTSAATAAVTAAQTGTVVWEATLTSANSWAGLGTYNYDGYGSDDSQYLSSSHGSLSPSSFTIGATTHTVELLAVREDFDQALFFFTDTKLGVNELAEYFLEFTVDGVKKTLQVSAETDATDGNEVVGLFWQHAVHSYGASDWQTETISVRLVDTSNTPATGAPTISGTAAFGEPMRAVTSGIMDSDGLTTPGYTYQWIRVDGATESDISGAISSIYTPVAADLGKTIKVTVSFTDDLGNAETLTSTATVTVTAAAVSTTHTYISNINQGQDNANSSTLVRAQPFSTGSQTGGYAVTHVEIGSDDDQGDSFSAAIYTTNASGNPDSEFAPLTPPSSFAKGALSFTAPANTVLMANETYTVRIVKSSDDSLTLDTTLSDGQDGGGAAGWSIGNVAHRQLSDGSWSNLPGSAAIRIAIKGTTPAPVDFSDLQSGHTSPIGMWSPDGSTLWVGQWFSTQVYAYNLSDETANYSENWTLHNPSTAGDRNRKPTGIWSNANRIYVTDPDHGRVFQYRCEAVSWDATMSGVASQTVGSTIFEGYFDSAHGSISTSEGTLDPASFTVDGVEYQVQKLAFATNGNRALNLWTNPAVSKNTPANVRLRITIGGTTKDLGTPTASHGSNGVTWQLSTHGYSSGDWDNTNVKVELFRRVSPDSAACNKKTLTSANYTLHADNGSRNGLWSDGTTAWVSDAADSKLYAYVLSDFSRDSGKDIDLHSDNAAARDIWSDGTTIWVLDKDDEKLYAYALADSSRAADLDITLDSAGENYNSIWSDGTTMYVVENTGGSATRDPQIHKLAMPAAGNSAATGAPTISGTAQVGETLTAATSGIMDSNGLTTPGYTYQWVRVDGSTESDISGATDDTYTLVAADLGKTIKVTVSFTDDANNSETLTSTATTTVAAAVPGAPLNLRARAGDEAVMFTWGAPPNNGAAITGYRIRFKVSAATAWEDWVTVPTLSATVTGLINDTSYDFEVQAQNSAGWSASAAVGATPSASAPGGVSAGGPDDCYPERCLRSLDMRNFDWGRTVEPSGEIVYPVRPDVRGIWSDGNTYYIIDKEYAEEVITDGWSLTEGKGYGKVVAFELKADLTGFERREESDFALDRANINATGGFWGNDTTVWVADDAYWAQDGFYPDADDRAAGWVAKLFAYNRSDGSRDAGKDFTTLTAAGNDHPAGIWSDGTTMWVADSRDGKLYAYRMSDRSRDAGKDFPLWKMPSDLEWAQGGGSVEEGKEWARPRGIWSDGTTMWVAGDKSAGDTHVFAYKMSDKSRDRSKEFSTRLSRGSDRVPAGVWSDGDSTMWIANPRGGLAHAAPLPGGNAPVYPEPEEVDTTGVLVKTLNVGNHPVAVWGDEHALWVIKSDDDTGPDRGPNDVVAYDPATYERLPDLGFELYGGPNFHPGGGAWSNGETVWISDSEAAMLFAYDLPGGSFDTDSSASEKNFKTLDAAGNDSPAGIWSDGTTMWVADKDDRKVYAYRMDNHERDPGKDISLTQHSKYSAAGIWSDGEVMWVGVNCKCDGPPIHAYNLETGERVPDRDIDPVNLGPYQGQWPGFPKGLWSDGQTMWVANPHNPTLRGFQLPGAVVDPPAQAPATVSGPPELFQATAAGAAQVDLLWTTPASGVTATGYDIEWSADGETWQAVDPPDDGADTIYSHTGLTPETTYFYRMRYVTEDGPGDWTDPVAATTAPDAWRLTATASSETQIELSWTPPDREVAAYLVEWSADGLSGWTAVEPAHSGTEAVYSHAGLTADTAYHYRVRAVIGHFPGPWSPAGGASTASWGLAATSVSETQIDLTWTPPGGEFTGYELEWSADGQTGWTAVEPAHSGTESIYSHTGLTPDTAYHYRVRGVNDDGPGLWGILASATTHVANSLPTGAPAITGTAQVGETLAADASGISDANGLTGAAFSYQWLAGNAVISGATGSAYTLTPADGGQPIRVRVTFTDDAGNEETVTSAATPAALTPVATIMDYSVSTGSEGDARVELIWRSPDGSEPTGYYVEWSQGEVYNWEWVFAFPLHSGTETGYAHDYLLWDTTYYYRVRAMYGWDEGDWSPVFAATTTEKENNPATGAPAIIGGAQVGETLTADTSGISDEDGLDHAVFGYQWLADGAEISGATGSNYALSSDDDGKTISLAVTFIDDAINEESLTSAATAAVAAAQTANTPATGAPAISGTAREGQTLTADTSGIADEDGLDNATFSYQWLADGSETQDATDATYTPVVDDVGKAISVTVSFTDDAGNEEELTSAATDAVEAKPNTPATGAPNINGTAQVGETLTADTSDIADEDGLEDATFSYQWLADGSETQDATDATYTPVVDDVGKAISVTVSFTDDAGNEETLTSAATAAVEAKPNTPATGAPAITGTAQVGETLTADTSGIADADGLEDAVFSYQWLADGSETQDATDATYTPVVDDMGKAMSVTVTFTDDAGNEEELASAATDAVEPETQEAKANTPATGAPTVSGTAQVGETLTADTSGIADEDGLDNASFAYQWLTDGADISGETDSSYTLADADEGKAVSVKVTFTDDAGNDESLTSAATDAVEAKANNPATGLPTISGIAQVGVKLTADLSEIVDLDGVFSATLNYQWQADGVDIPGETLNCYTPDDADEGKTISVVVSFTDDAGNDESLTSAATAAVEARPNRPATGALTITGTARVGELLTADVSGIMDDDGLDRAAFAYQWQADSTDLSGATGSSYTLAASDEGKAMSVTVSFTDYAGHEESFTSAATAAVAAAAEEDEEPTDRPHGLTAEASGGAVVLTWTAPVVDYVVTSYHILRHRPEQGEAEPLVYVDQTPNKDTSYTDTGVEPGVLYVYRVKAIVNWMGDLGEASDAAQIRAQATSQQQTANNPATGAPTITGKAQVGETLTADTSGIADDDGLSNATFSYQWLADSTDIAGATGSTYTLADSDEGKAISVKVSFTDDAGNEEESTSAATDAVEAKPNSPATGAPTINGTAQVGAALTAETSGIEDADGLTNAAFSYQWQADGADISGATDSSYTLADADVGKAISVTVSFTDDAGHEETLASAATDAVDAKPNTPATGAPTINGTAQVGETLSVDTSGIADEDGLTNAVFSYQWQADGADISGATDSSHTLADADEGKAISVTVSFTDDAGHQESLTSAATAAVEAAPLTPLTALIENAAASHDGESVFTFELRFSEEFGISYKTLRDHAFTVSGGTVRKAQRIEQGSNIGWRITVRPDGNGDVTITLPETTDCDAQGAICTEDGRMLSNELVLTVSGP